MRKVNLFLSLNEWCNLDCSYCNVVKTHKKLSFEDCKKSFLYFFRSFQDADGYNIFFIGGEPMLSYNEIQKSVLWLRDIEKKLKKDIMISMPSNGTLFNEENLEFLSRNHVNVSLSIDSFDDTYNYRNVRDTAISSSSLLMRNIGLYQRFAHILRIKVVVMPDQTPFMQKRFLVLQKLGFTFINMQPAHGVYWSLEQSNSYLKNFLIIKKYIQGNSMDSASFKGSECADKSCQSGCAKGVNEICIDSYGNIMVCDAFLAFSPEKRIQYAHDNLYKKNFNRQKFQEYSSWKYCNNTILGDSKDLTKCQSCNETKSCSKLCDAIPINGQDYDEQILRSNFQLFHKLDILGA